MNKTQKFWDTQAKRYDSNERQFEPLFEEIIAKTREYLNTDDRVLDFGCGTGTKTMEFVDSVNHIQGLDFSTEMINRATEKKNERALENISFSSGTIFDTDFEKETFDTIISYGVLHLLDDCDRVIQRIHELLKPKGLFISTTACLKDKMALKSRLEFSLFFLIKKLGLFPLHLNMFKTSDIEEIIGRNNFTLENAEQLFHGISISFVVGRK